MRVLRWEISGWSKVAKVGGHSIRCFGGIFYFTDGYGGPGSVNSWALRIAGDLAGYASQVRAVRRTLCGRGL
jgi:hypothetical protein